MCIDSTRAARSEGQSFTSTLNSFSSMTRAQKSEFIKGAKENSGADPSINAALAVIESLAGRV